MRLTGGSVATRVGDKLDPAMPIDGTNGWSPVLAGEADGVRSLLKVVDWTGGQGNKPATGYIADAVTGVLVADKAAAFNFNLAKRVQAFSAISDASGIAAVTFSGLSKPPVVICLGAVPAAAVGGIKAEVVAGTITKDGCQVKVTGAALLSSLVIALVGATATVLTIES